MSKKVMIDLLEEGDTGAEILQILDTLTSDNQQAVPYAEPTADVVEL